MTIVHCHIRVLVGHHSAVPLVQYSVRSAIAMIVAQVPPVVDVALRQQLEDMGFSGNK